MVVGELGPGAVGTRAGSAEDGTPHLPQHDRHGDLDQSRGPGLGFREDGGRRRPIEIARIRRRVDCPEEDIGIWGIRLGTGSTWYGNCGSTTLEVEKPRERERERVDEEEHGKASSGADKARAGPVRGPRGVAREGRNEVPPFPSGLTFVTRRLPSRPGPLLFVVGYRFSCGTHLIYAVTLANQNRLRSGFPKTSSKNVSIFHPYHVGPTLPYTGRQVSVTERWKNSNNKKIQ